MEKVQKPSNPMRNTGFRNIYVTSTVIITHFFQYITCSQTIQCTEQGHFETTEQLICRLQNIPYGSLEITEMKASTSIEKTTVISGTMLQLVLSSKRWQSNVIFL
jgi:hypothetical protein